MAVETVALRDLCEQIVDCPHSTPVWTDAGEIVLRSNNIRNGRLDLSSPSYTDAHHFELRTKRAAPRSGDLVITREAPMGEVCLIPEGLRCCLGQRMVLLRPDPDKTDSRYLLYALQSRSVQHEIGVNEGTGSTVSNLRIPLLEALRIPWRPLPEQRRIAHILGTLDDKIELNRRMSQTLEEMARALFKSWFVDFDPVRAKAESRDTGLPKHVADLFPDRLVDSELGPIPGGWRVGRIEDLATIHGGSTPSTKEPEYWAPEIHHWATPKDLAPLDIPVLNATARKISVTGLAMISSGLNPIGTVLLSSRAPVGYLAIAEVPVAVNQGFIALRPHANVPGKYLQLWADSNMEIIKANANGSTFMEISKSTFRKLPLVIPSDEVVAVFGRQSTTIHQRLVEVARENATLAASRDALLQELIH